MKRSNQRIRREGKQYEFMPGPDSEDTFVARLSRLMPALEVR